MAPIDAGIEGTVAYLAQAYAAGESLDAAVRQYGPAPVPQAMRILSSVADVLDLAAAAGVYHGALHPRDVLVTADDLWLTGVGVASALDAIGVRAPMRRPYTAPERLQGDAWDGRADVFSLGVLARELLAGRRRRGDADTGILGPPDADDLAARIDPVCARATAARPSDRFGTAREVIAALEAAMAAPPDPSGVVPASARSAPPPDEELRLPLFDVGPEDPASLDLSLDDQGLPEPSDPSEAGAPGIDDLRIGDGGGQPDRSPDVDDLPAAFTAAHDEPSRFGDLPVELESAPPADVPFQPIPQAFSHVGRPAAARWSASALVVTLVAGLAIGSAAGYWFGFRQGVAQRPAAPPASEPARSEAPPQTPAVTASPSVAPPAAQASAPGQGQAPASAQPAGATGAPSASPAPPVAAGPTSGRLTVRSAPTGATVTVNGRARGTTPLTLRGLEAGRYVVRVARRGYVTDERAAVLDADHPSASLTFQLVRGRGAGPDAFVGSLSVQSQPSGARVFLDGRLVGTTPAVVPGVAAGSHVVLVDLLGFTRWTQAVQVVAGQRLRVTAALEREGR